MSNYSHRIGLPCVCNFPVQNISLLIISDESVSAHVDRRLSFGRLKYNSITKRRPLYTLASGISWAYKSSDYDFRRVLVPHIDLCISLCKDGPIVSCYSGSDQIEITARFALAFVENVACGAQQGCLKRC